MQKTLTIRHLAAATEVTAARVSSLLDEAGVGYEAIDTVDWPENYPYCPEVKFRMAHTGDSLLIEYTVREESVRAVAPADNGRVWEDACCEFFFSPADDGVYYNVESNCAAQVLVECGSGRGALRKKADPELLKTIDRCSSLGREPFEERIGDCQWRMTLVVPKEVFFQHPIDSFSGLTARGNFYKCGDKLQTPHFLSWNRILTEKPDFHRPDFFGTLIFQ